MAIGSVTRGFRSFVRRNFLAGMLTVLPLAVTFWIISWMIDVLESGVRLLPRFMRPDYLLPFYFPAVGALVTIVMIMGVGFIVSNTLSKRATAYVNRLVLRIPFVRGIYGSAQRLVEAILLPKHENFRRVVLIEYPRKGMYAVGLMTGVTEGEVQERTTARLINVFVPTTPNPTSGYYVLVPEGDIIPLTMTVEEAFKLVMSGGIVTPPTPIAGESVSDQRAPEAAGRRG
jgi:uncharacterized membrane protein